MNGSTSLRITSSLLAAALTLQAAAGAEFEVGGPLAGVRVPLYKTQHGEEAGYPGCVPELQADAKAKDPESQAFTPQDQHPERELYPGAVEHWRTYWQHYMPIRSFFDAQSQLKRYTAPDLPGAPPEQAETYAEPVYWVGKYPDPVDTGRRNRPVPVVRCRVKAPVFALDLGTLDPGLYALRWVGAVEKERLRPFRLPAYVALRVNDGLQGETNQYRTLTPYVDEFYSMAEMYFYAPERREYRAEMWLDQGSQVEVLVHDIMLEDVLTGTQNRRIKRRGMSMLQDPSQLPGYSVWLKRRFDSLPPEEQQACRDLLGSTTQEERFARDAAIWNGLPHPNCHPAYNKLAMTDGARPGGGIQYEFGVDGVPLEEIEEQWGKWEMPKLQKGQDPWAEPDPVLLVNQKLGKAYSMGDLAAGRPLPDPYPYKDTGAGLYTPDPDDPAKGQVFFSIGRALNGWDPYYGLAHKHLGTMGRGAQQWAANRNAREARDAAMALVRFAYLYPAIDPNNTLHTAIFEYVMRNRAQCRRRVTYQIVYGSFIAYHAPLQFYDVLFDYIEGNEDLARSVARFVPWVETPDDVLRLIDVYLLQTMAKRTLRYYFHGDGRQPWRISEIASCAGNNDFTRPWMDWLFTRTFLYPQPLGGIQDYMITGTDRDGRSPIGSYSYMIGEFSADVGAAQIENYIALGGDPRYDLRDFERFPKTRTALDFYARSRTAGFCFPRIGDVSGPDKVLGQKFETIVSRAERGWRWTGDPAFAFTLAHYADRTELAELDWEEIDAAARGAPKAPWFENRSRILPGYAAFLETGLEHDDYRFRRSAMLRIGYGVGHSHYDGLDLQLHAHGLPMTLDAGQRGGYGSPSDKNSYVHNTVTVDEERWGGHSWAQAVADVEDARYLRVQGAHTRATGLFRRQVALIDVDEGLGSVPLTPAQMQPQPPDMPTNVLTPNSYLFDVFRVSGGSNHWYCFHATVNDTNGPQPMTTAENVRPYSPEAGPHMLSGYSGERYEADLPEVLEVVFPMQKKRTAPGKGSPEAGSEMFFARNCFDEQSPGKFVKWRVFDRQDAVLTKGDQHCINWEYYMPMFLVRKAGPESVFAAAAEPYAGQPFIASARPLELAANEDDALAAVAVEFRIAPDDRVARAARTDVCFADGRPDRERRFRCAMPVQNAPGSGGADSEWQVRGEFVFLSMDAQGLRQAVLTGGTLLAGPGLRIEAAVRERAGRIVACDYARRQARIDQPWPSFEAERIVEIGDISGGGAGGYVTGYTVTSVRPDADGAVLTFLRSADYYRSLIKEVDGAAGRVTCNLNVPGAGMSLRGLNRNFTASNDDQTKFWRADVGDAPSDFILRGGTVKREDFEPQGAMRLWEYGVGDAVRQNTFLAVRRLSPGVYGIEGNVDGVVMLGDRTCRVSAADFAGSSRVTCSADRAEGDGSGR